MSYSYTRPYKITWSVRVDEYSYQTMDETLDFEDEEDALEWARGKVRISVEEVDND